MKKTCKGLWKKLLLTTMLCLLGAGSCVGAGASASDQPKNVQEAGSYVLKGAVCYSTAPQELHSYEQAYVVCVEGRCQGVFTQLPQQYAHLPVQDYGSSLIIPGMVDLHLHAPQYAFRGMHMDLELLDWLNAVTFPEEAKYSDAAYATQAYSIFARDLQQSVTTRAAIFATLHVDSTLQLMDLLEQTGLKTYVGKVNMDRNAPESLCEDSAQDSLQATERWLEACAANGYKNTMPMLTPRFIPSCTDELMTGLGQLQQRTGLPMQSHLSENLSEIAWVQELCPTSSSYGDAYHSFGLFGGSCPTIMAHCVHSTEQEVDLMEQQGVFIAHCPQSNTNLSSGIAPARLYLDKGLNMGLGSDIAGGSSVSLFRGIVDAIQVSKLRWRLVDSSLKPLSFREGFYLATMGGGAFWGQVGSFLPGYELDALVIDDSGLPHPQELSTEERLERVVYLQDKPQLQAKFVAGKRIL